MPPGATPWSPSSDEAVQKYGIEASGFADGALVRCARRFRWTTVLRRMIDIPAATNTMVTPNFPEASYMCARNGGSESTPLPESRSCAMLSTVAAMMMHIPQANNPIPGELRGCAQVVDI